MRRCEIVKGKAVVYPLLELNFLIRLLFFLGLVGVACSEVDAAARLRPAPSIRPRSLLVV